MRYIYLLFTYFTHLNTIFTSIAYSLKTRQLVKRDISQMAIIVRTTRWSSGPTFFDDGGPNFRQPLFILKKRNTKNHVCCVEVENQKNLKYSNAVFSNADPLTGSLYVRVWIAPLVTVAGMMLLLLPMTMQWRKPITGGRFRRVTRVENWQTGASPRINSMHFATSFDRSHTRRLFCAVPCNAQYDDVNGAHTIEIKLKWNSETFQQ